MTETYEIVRASDRAKITVVVSQESTSHQARGVATITPVRVRTDRELAAVASRFGPKLVEFCAARIGTVEGNGECWTLADNAIKAQNGELEIALSYNFGQRIDFRSVEPGDVAQFTSCRFEYPNGSVSTAGEPNHTAIVVEKTSNSSFSVFEQNPSPVRLGSYDLSRKTRGEIVFYRPLLVE